MGLLWDLEDLVEMILTWKRAPSLWFLPPVGVPLLTEVDLLRPSGFGVPDEEGAGCFRETTGPPKYWKKMNIVF